jgi:hypothetical protein
MNPAMIGFFFGVLVGGLGVILLIGLLFLDREPEEANDILQIQNDSYGAFAKLKMSKAFLAFMERFGRPARFRNEPQEGNIRKPEILIDIGRRRRVRNIF